MRRQGGKDGRYLVLFKGGESRERRGRTSSRFSCLATGMERLSLDFPRAVKNIVRCGSLWNL